MKTTCRAGSALLLLAALASLPLAADSNVTTDAFLPIVHVNGASGTWQSDVSVFNPNGQATKVTFYFGAADTDATNAPGYQLSPDLQSRETVTLTDVLVNTFNVSSGYGTLEVRSDLPILVTSNTYNVRPNCTGGTFGQFSPGQPERNSVGYGTTNDYDLYVAGIVHDQNHLTSAAIMNPTGNTLHATMQLVDGAGNSWGSVTGVVPPFSLHQFSDLFRGGAFGSLNPSYDNAWRLNFYVNTNTGATLLAYVTITDVRSGDPYLIPAQAQVVNVPAAVPAPQGAVRTEPLAAPAERPKRGEPTFVMAPPRG